MKTIRQIANEIGVSKQAVFKKMKCEPLSTSLQGLTTTVDGKLMVSVDGEKLIKQAFFKDEPSTNHQPVDGGWRQLVDGKLTVSVDGKKPMKREFSKDKPSTNHQPVDGRLTVSVDGEDLGAEVFLESAPQKDCQKEDAFLAALESTIDALKNQLATKDKQIENMQKQVDRLYEELAEERKHGREQAEKLAVLADQAQRLQLAQMHPELTAIGETHDESESSRESTGLFQRLFRRK